MKLSKYKNQLLMILLAVGFLIGILYQNIASKQQGSSEQLLQTYLIKEYVNIQIIAEEYLWYVAKLRVIPLVLLCVCGTLRWRKIVVGFVVAWTGFLVGVLAVSAVMGLGIKGILLCVIGMFPQMVFYGLAYGMVIVYLYQYPRRQWNVAKSVFMILTMFLGLMLEVYLNPMLLRWLISWLC